MDGEADAVLSQAALQLYSYGILMSIEAGHPGFVPDNFLNAVSEDTTTSAVELWTARLWERTEDGYLVVDGEMFTTFLEAVEEVQSIEGLDDDDQRPE